MKEHDTADIGEHGGVSVDLLQRYLNFHYTVSLDLFGAETSTNAANYFASGIKGRFQEPLRDDDHQLKDATRPIAAVEEGRLVERDVPALSALNETLRADFVTDCQKGVDRWNRTLAQVGAELRLPHIGFNRSVGNFRDQHVTPAGEVVSEAEWEAQRHRWLPTDDDQQLVKSLMTPVHERGKMAGWIAPPASGIHAKPVDYEYVRV
jgi:benzoyl-CoA 2,3-epoxidase subunit B